MRVRLRSLLWLAATVSVIFLLSGAPQWAPVLLGLDDCCSQECESTLGAKHCPPNCNQGHCARLFSNPTAEAQPAMLFAPSMRMPVPIPLDEPRLSAIPARLFHPPKA